MAHVLCPSFLRTLQGGGCQVEHADCARREYFVDLLLSDRRHPMLLEECTSVLEVMDGQTHPVEIMQLRFREGRETVGVKVLHK